MWHYQIRSGCLYDDVLYHMLGLAPAWRLQVAWLPQETLIPDTVPAIFELDPETAAALDDPTTCTRVERMIRRTVRPASVERLFKAMDALSAEARRRGLTDDILEAELAAYNAERRDAPPGA